MPLYTDSSGIYWTTGGASTSSRDQYSSYLPGAYVSYNRPTYSLPSTPSSSLRSNYTTSSSRYHPKLSTITETPYSSRGLTPLTRINSPKVSPRNSTTYQSAYVPARPININTADIDVSEKRFKGHEEIHHLNLAPITSITESNETESKPSDQNNSDLKIGDTDEQEENKTDTEFGSFVNRSTIKRNRAVVRLSMSRPKGSFRPDPNILSPKKKKIEQINGSDSTNDTNTAESSLSWRQKVGEDLLKPIKNVKKSPGEIMREKHFIPIDDEKTESKRENESKEIIDIDVPENLKPKEGEPTDLIIEIDPLTHTAVRRLSIPRCPDFQDFCQDISSDKLDDLNAGALRRRASLIQEQEIELLNQLQKSASGSVQLIHLERVESPTELVPTKRKSKKKRIRHKITATVDIENALPLVENLTPVLSPLPQNDEQENSPDIPAKKSPKISYKVDEIEENQTFQTTVTLPKKKKKIVVKTLEKIENQNAMKSSPKKIKVTKKMIPSKGKSGQVEKMEEVSNSAIPQQQNITSVTVKPENAEKHEIPAPKLIKDDLKLSKINDLNKENGDIKTPNSLPASPLKKSKALTKNKSTTSLADNVKNLTSNTTPEYFKFDSESISKVENSNILPQSKKTETPKSIVDENKLEEVKLREKKSKPVVNKIEKSDSVGDFWSTVGSRETVYFNRRKHSLLENQWNKCETLLDDEDMKNLSNLDCIKEKVTLQKNEELKESAEGIEGRRPRSNESSLREQNKDFAIKDEKISKTENTSKEPNQLETNKIKVKDTKLLKDLTSPPTTPITKKPLQSKDLPNKLPIGINAKSAEIINQKKNDVPKLPSDLNKTESTDAASPKKLITTNSEDLNKICSKKLNSTFNDVESSAFNEQGKGILASKSTSAITTKTAAITDAKLKILNKSDADINKKQSKIGSSTQSSPSFTTSKDKLSTTTEITSALTTDINKTQQTDNVAKHESNVKEKIKENKLKCEEKISPSITEGQKKIEDKDKNKIKPITATTTTTKVQNNDDAVGSGKPTSTTSAADDVQKDNNKFAKVNKEITSEPKIKNKINTTATAKDNVANKKENVAEKLKINNVASSTTLASTTSTTADSTVGNLKLANNSTTDDKSIDNSGGSNNTTKSNLKIKTNLYQEPKTITTPTEAKKDERASQQLSYKKVLNKTREEKFEEIKNSDGSGGNLQKFDTVANLNEFLYDVDAEVKDLSPDDKKTNKSADSENSDSDNSSDNDNMKRKDKKQKQKITTPEPEPFNRNRVKLDHGKKLYVKDEVTKKYQLIATPRPLWKPEKFIHYNSDSSSDESSDDETTDTDDDSECETSSGNDSGGEDELNPHQKNNCLIRMSTCSNDSGFVGGTAPTNPKKMLAPHDARDSPSTPPSHNPAFKIDTNYDPDDETSYTYAQFQKTGRITAPATNIPRFKKYAVEDFHFLAVLGKGSFGKVLLAELRNSEYYYAVKCLKKDVVLEDDDVECTLIERKVLALGTKHPFLCHLFCTFQTESHLFFVMEYLNGGDLMFHIQQTGRFQESRARFYAAEIVSGLKFLHKKGIIYRDLKLDNVLLDFDGHVRIADFGMCKLQIYLDKTADSFCGTPDYMAPEIIKGDNYNQNVDWWSFGVLLYEMLIGQSPFSGCDEEYLFWSICNEVPMYPMCLTQEATNLLKALLEKDSNKRIGSQYSPQGDILLHPFFASIEWDLLEKRQIEPPFKPQVKHPLDTKYFDKTFTRERVRLTPIDKEILHSMDQAQFQGFSYTNPNATLD